MRYRIEHLTRYQYSEAVTVCHNLAHLIPRSMDHQEVVQRTLHVTPTPAVLYESTDYFNNCLHYFEVLEPHQQLEVLASSEVVVLPRAPLSWPTTYCCWEQVRDALCQSDDPDICYNRPFMFDSPLIRSSDCLAQFAANSFSAGRTLLDAVNDLMQRIYREFTYCAAVTTVTTPLEEVMQHRQGVCQDFAHVAIGSLRAIGLAARYVSGYLETSPPPGKSRLIGADASHAWFAVFVPGQGWIDFDPTNNLLPQERHITLATGRDYSDVAPLKGVILGGGQETLHVSVDVAPLP
ncbi:MAG: transglutaminase family protein [Magnetococcales bacterium]|nr:transglutaminase family protein [Magnetococcales bacterium]